MEVTTRLGIGLKDDECRALMASLDINGDGELSFQEFCDALKSVGFISVDEEGEDDDDDDEEGEYEDDGEVGSSSSDEDSDDEY